jgi:hypothetical protein
MVTFSETNFMNLECDSDSVYDPKRIKVARLSYENRQFILREIIGPKTMWVRLDKPFPICADKVTALVGRMILSFVTRPWKGAALYSLVANSTGSPLAQQKLDSQSLIPHHGLMPPQQPPCIHGPRVAHIDARVEGEKVPSPSHSGGQIDHSQQKQPGQIAQSKHNQIVLPNSQQNIPMLQLLRGDFHAIPFVLPLPSFQQQPVPQQQTQARQYHGVDLGMFRSQIFGYHGDTPVGPYSIGPGFSSLPYPYNNPLAFPINLGTTRVQANIPWLSSISMMKNKGWHLP